MNAASAIAAALRQGPPPVTRFAPAPTGFLHIGHVVNAVWVWGLTRAVGGRVLLRIEDHDRGRCRPEFEAAILDELDWLGLEPDGASTADFRRGAHPQRQSDNVARYADCQRQLERDGLAYPCTCSRADIARATGAEPADSSELRYPGTCRRAHHSPNETPARRVVMDGLTPERFEDLRLGHQEQDPVHQCGDVLIRDRHGNYTYQFAVTVDDMDQGVTLIVRGEDLLSSTGRQLRLARLLGRQHPPQFLHHPLVLHPDGRKLSKSAGDVGVAEMRTAGLTPAAVLGRAAVLGGLMHDGGPLDASELARLFR